MHKIWFGWTLFSQFWIFVKIYCHNYNDKEYDYDLCSNPDEAHVTTGSCSHDEFFDSSVVERIQDKLIFEKSETRPCCKEHEYVFKDYCEV